MVFSRIASVVLFGLPPLQGGAAAPASPLPAAHSLERVVVIGASMTAGAQLERDLGAVLEASLLREPRSVRTESDLFFFGRPTEVGPEQVAFVRESDPTLVVGIDFPFWFGYGSKNVDGQPIASEEERLVLLEHGLKLLEPLACPIVIGDFPDMSDSVGRMLTAPQMPAPETLVTLNMVLYGWAEEHPNVVVVPLSRTVADLRGGDAFRIGSAEWPAGSTDRMLQEDRLHPTLEGLVAVGHLVLFELVERELLSPEDVELDVKVVLARLGAATAPVEAGAGEGDDGY